MGGIRKPSETTWLDMANRALARLNQNLIKNFEEGTNSALQAELSLSAATSEVLNLNDWKSATKRVYLHPQSVKTIDGKYSYSLPTDFIRLVEVGLSQSMWVREGHTIVADTECDLYIRYVAFPDMPGTLDPLLISAITMMCAYKMSLNLTADTSIQAQLYSEATVAITAARHGETQGEEDEMYTTNDWKGGY